MQVQVGETCCVQIKRHNSMQRHLLPHSVQDDLGKFMNTLVHLSYEMMLNKRREVILVNCYLCFLVKFNCIIRNKRTTTSFISLCLSMSN
jgi:hypothetical protein